MIIIHWGELLGVPVVPTVSSKGKGIKKLFDKIIEVYENREPIVRHIHINYGTEIENSICAIQSRIKIDENRSLQILFQHDIWLLSCSKMTRNILKKHNAVFQFRRDN